jgi:hypothetical protein
MSGSRAHLQLKVEDTRVEMESQTVVGDPRLQSQRKNKQSKNNNKNKNKTNINN